MSGRKQWEVRHGGCVGLKYLGVTVTPRLKRAFPSLIGRAVNLLLDPSDDVKGGAAQILSGMMLTGEASVASESFSNAWNALSSTNDLSSHATDLIKLIGLIAGTDEGISLLRTVDCSALFRFLSHSSVIVQSEGMKLLTTLAKTAAAAAPNFVPTLLARLFRVLRSVQQFEGADGRRLNAERMEAWKVALGELAHWDHLDTFVKEIIQTYFRGDFAVGGIGSDAVAQRHSNLAKCHCGLLSPTNFKIIMQSASSVSLLLSKIEEVSTDTRAATAALDSIRIMMASPFIQDAEMACLLYEKLPPKLRDGGIEQDLLGILARGNGESAFSPILFRSHVERSGRTFVLVSQELSNFLANANASSSSSAVVKKIEVSASQSAPVPRAAASSGVDGPTFTTVRFDSIVASAYVSKCHSLPNKLNKLIQTLMTSVKYESDPQRRSVNSACLSALVAELIGKGEDRHKSALHKILNNLLAGAANNVPNAEDCIAMLGRRYRGSIFDEIGELKELVLGTLTAANVTLGPSLYPAVKVLSLFSASLEGEGLRLMTEGIPNLAHVACCSKSAAIKGLSVTSITSMMAKKSDQDGVDGGCDCAAEKIFPLLLPTVFQVLKNDAGKSSSEFGANRQNAIELLLAIVSALGVGGTPFVTTLLPVAMSFMNDSFGDVGKLAANMFSKIIRIAPLVVIDSSEDSGKGRTVRLPPFNSGESGDGVKERNVIKHLIHGQPLPKLALSENLKGGMKGVKLRGYQEEGVTWLDFLFSTSLNGVLSDEMGLGKTLQSLVAIAMQHQERASSGTAGEKKSLIVCPATLCGHWMNEISKFFKPSIFRPLLYAGNSASRLAMRSDGSFKSANIIITSYSKLRADVNFLASPSSPYLCVVLDEGHLLKNPNTATSMAARKLESKHKLILTGTPVQNKVEELWATFDFLMPQFLGSSKKFMAEYGNIIGEGLRQGEEALMSGSARDKLKMLHQQVLPFILRREKKDVLKELPDKVVTDIFCELSDIQKVLYKRLVRFVKNGSAGNESSSSSSSRSADNSGQGSSDTHGFLKYLLYLRLLCVHPVLVDGREGQGERDGRADDDIFDDDTAIGRYSKISCSGKLSTLLELLVSSGIVHDERLTAADGDTSAIFVGVDTEEDLAAIDGKQQEQDRMASGVTADATGGGDDAAARDAENEEVVEGGPLEQIRKRKDGRQSKCLIFAQHTKSLDVVESHLFRPHAPSLQYLRLDGKTSPSERFKVAQRFNEDDEVRVLLMTTKVGGLGLNLTGANVVIFLEHDYNPVNDIQAMDRAHRIGQQDCVNVYRLITKGTIEEKIMTTQKAKVRMGDSIVTSDNSSMFAMGTDRILDLIDLEDEGNESKDDGGSGQFSPGGVCNINGGNDYARGPLEAEEEREFDNLNLEKFVEDMGRSP